MQILVNVLSRSLHECLAHKEHRQGLQPMPYWLLSAAQPIYGNVVHRVLANDLPGCHRSVLVQGLLGWVLPYVSVQSGAVRSWLSLQILQPSSLHSGNVPRQYYSEQLQIMVGCKGGV
jgi:hypothetical protein